LQNDSNSFYLQKLYIQIINGGLGDMLFGVTNSDNINDIQIDGSEEKVDLQFIKIDTF